MAANNSSLKTQKKEPTSKKNVINLSEKWQERLSRLGDGSFAKTIDNFCIVLENDEMFKGKIKANSLSGQIEILDKNGKTRPIQDVDVDRMKRIIEKKYGMYNEKKFESAVRETADNNSYNPIMEYLETLKWDGVKRLDTGFADYLGAEENAYNAMCLRLVLFGAIERIYNPGAQFDYMLILKGAQGIGKSSFFKMICGDMRFYQEDVSDVSSDKVIEKTQGKWFVEMSELTAMKKADVDRLKTYITKRNETYRVPYGRFAKDYPRSFVLIGTTNEERFLIDDTGERRFPIVQITKDKDRTKLKKNMFAPGEKENIQQILAEALFEYKNGKKFLEIPHEFAEHMAEMQSMSKEDDYRVGVIESYLEHKEYCCPFEIWCEAFGHTKKDKYPRIESQKIIQILEGMPNWRLYSGNKTHRKRIAVEVVGNYGLERHDYGSQICYERFKTIEEREEELRKIEEEKQKVATDNLNKITGQNLEYKDYYKKV